MRKISCCFFNIDIIRHIIRISLASQDTGSYRYFKSDNCLSLIICFVTDHRYTVTKSKTIWQIDCLSYAKYNISYRKPVCVISKNESLIVNKWSYFFVRNTKKYDPFTDPYKTLSFSIYDQLQSYLLDLVSIFTNLMRLCSKRRRIYNIIFAVQAYFQ
jgi:hypothetical protein